MKQLTFLIVLLGFFHLTSCLDSGNKVLFNGKSADKWDLKNKANVKDSALNLPGKEAMAILKNGEYKDFQLSMKVKTAPSAKGTVYFHTNDQLSKGYQIVLNNNANDSEWWKKTGSLSSVRNLTKSFVKENEWFDLSIIVDGRLITVKINSEPVVEYIEPVNPYRIEPNNNALLSAGTIALVNDSDCDIQFKDISISIPEKQNENYAIQQANAIDEQTDPIIKLHQENFPVLDYHVHLKGGLTKEVAAQQSRKVGINYAIAPNCGIGFPITNDAEIISYLDTMRSQPFILAMQAEGREWLTTFSPEARNEFDYVFTDALTFTDHKGRRTRLWIPEETFIDIDQQKYMDLIVDRICGVLQEPVNIYVNPCFLPAPMNQQYDVLWTEARINKFVDALAKSGKALEINELYQIPNKAIIQKAKEAGVKFTFGSNNVTPNVSDLAYSLRMKKECNLTASDMYKPTIKLN